MTRDLQSAGDKQQTNVEAFLARRGCLVMKVMKKFPTQLCDYGRRLKIESMILAIAQSRDVDRSFGIRIACESDGQFLGSCYLDFDELKEVLLAIKYIIETARTVVEQQEDYTEFEYRSRGQMRVGFCQDTKKEQRVYVDVSEIGEAVFMSFDDLKDLFKVIKQARDHLIENGASSADTE